MVTKTQFLSQKFKHSTKEKKEKEKETMKIDQEEEEEAEEEADSELASEVAEEVEDMKVIEREDLIAKKEDQELKEEMMMDIDPQEDTTMTKKE